MSQHVYTMLRIVNLCVFSFVLRYEFIRCSSRFIPYETGVYVDFVLCVS